MVSVKKLGIGGGVLFILGLVLWIGFPIMIKSKIKKVSDIIITFTILICILGIRFMA